ncbi:MULTISPECIES: hypothetical protein [unclassified Bradyrhizobium]|uniref:hypothetical protein n=1 Tax=unclassified Bradyrhizobium TaxID=2631580 RepID=UPI0028E5C88B|nr:MULTISPECIES: hypothetical protein [unclassified Bradyrhizobium]
MDGLMEYLTDAKLAVDTIKGIIGLLPAGQQRDKAQADLAKAETALDTSKAEIAKALGHKLCKCTFPPQIMLWKEDLKTNVCPECGHQNPPRHDPPQLKPGRFGGVA